MKKLLLPSLAVIVLFFSACSNDFEVAAPWKDIPVVYGLLDISDTAHYIRVEKAFLDPDGDALEIAKIADSLYYPNATVILEKQNGTTFTLERVDGNDWGFPREEGVFATEPNWLYRIDSSELLLKPNEIIKLRIDRGNGLPEVTGTTMVLAPLKLNTPSGSTPSLRFNYFTPTNIAWSAPTEATIFDANLYIRYAEYPFDDPDSIAKKTIKWNWAMGLRRESGSNGFSAEKEGIEFFNKLKAEIPEDGNMKRVFLGIDIEVIGGSEDVESYLNIGLANTGITSSQELPFYSNLSEGRGIFSSLTRLFKTGVGLNDVTRDSLKNGYLTKNLNF